MENVKVNVMMFGGRRCGKTSIIAAMKSCFDNVFGQDLVIVSSDQTAPILEEKKHEIEDFFNHRKNRSFTPDSNPSLDLNEYSFGIQVKKKKTVINLNFTDYPGEFIKNNRTLLGEIMKKSHIIMIAIDTPYLMEQTRDGKNRSVGIYNDRRNFCSTISEMLKNSFKDITDESFPVMIMFVPLKCEKYYNAGQMELVNEKIHTAYKSVFDFVEGVNKSSFEVVITPILTFGPDGIEFSRFGTDENGEIIEAGGLPEKPIYIFKGENGYEPTYCEQPLIYSLAYLLSVAEMTKKKENWFVSLFTEFFGKAASLQDFIEQKDRIIKTLKTTKNGFEVFSDPLKLRR